MFSSLSLKFTVLTQAYETWPAPLYVLLVGDGHLDPKYHDKDTALPTLLPPYLAKVGPWLGETAADNRYVTMIGQDTLPDMLIARLPVHDLDELDIVIDKIIRYETSPPAGNWAAHYLFVADNPDQAGNFAIDSNELYYVLNDNLFGHRFYYEPSLQQNQDTN